jgi:hypothetical protein
MIRMANRHDEAEGERRENETCRPGPSLARSCCVSPLATLQVGRRPSTRLGSFVSIIINQLTTIIIIIYLTLKTLTLTNQKTPQHHHHHHNHHINNHHLTRYILSPRPSNKPAGKPISIAQHLPRHLFPHSPPSLLSSLFWASLVFYPLLVFTDPALAPMLQLGYTFMRPCRIFLPSRSPTRVAYLPLSVSFAS